MENIFVSEGNNNNNNMGAAATPSLRQAPNDSVDLGAFDLDEALSSAADSCRRFAVSQSLVAALPAAGHVEGDAVCSVCMEGFYHSDDDGGGGNKQIACGHVYHSGCITSWISRSNSCPLCRSLIFLHHSL